jgi:hypothetical protein
MSAKIRAPVGLSRTRRLGVYAVGIGLWLTGALWLLFHYFLMRPGEFGPAADPLEAWWLTLHGAFAFLAIWTFGLLWGVHVANNWSAGRRRWSGALLVGVFELLIISGYLLYYLGDETLRPIASLVHWAVGLAGPIFFLAHRFGLQRKRQVGSDAKRAVTDERRVSVASALIARQPRIR